MNTKIIPMKNIIGIYEIMNLKMRMEEPGVNSVSSQIFTTQTFDKSYFNAGQLLLLSKTTPLPSPTNPN